MKENYTYSWERIYNLLIDKQFMVWWKHIYIYIEYYNDYIDFEYIVSNHIKIEIIKRFIFETDKKLLVVKEILEYNEDFNVYLNSVKQKIIDYLVEKLYSENKK